MEQILQSFFDIPFAAPILYGLVIWWPFKVYLRRVFAKKGKFSVRQEKILVLVDFLLFLLLILILAFIWPV